MTTVGGLSTSVVAAIAVAGCFGLIALVVVVAVLMDLPKRKQRKAHTGIMSHEESEKKSLEINEVGKGNMKVSIMELSIETQSSRYQSTQANRPASPECQCEYPSISIHPPRV